MSSFFTGDIDGVSNEWVESKRTLPLGKKNLCCTDCAAKLLLIDFLLTDVKAPVFEYT